MISDPRRRRDDEPQCVGPYTVVGRTRAGLYKLLDSRGVLFHRHVPPQQLKLVSKPSATTDAKSEAERVYFVEKVIAHRGPEGAREYLVKWYGYPSDMNTWEPTANFNDREAVLEQGDSHLIFLFFSCKHSGGDDVNMQNSTPTISWQLLLSQRPSHVPSKYLFACT